MTHQELVEAFSAKAAAVNAVVQEVPNMAAALQYVVDVCAKQGSRPSFWLTNPARNKAPLGPQ
jgi:hypothetical protein